MCQVACLLTGGPTYWILVRGKLRPFEDHPYCGPSPLNMKTMDPLDVEREPPGFWDACDRWKLGGHKLDGDRCVLPQWCEVCNRTGDEIKHLGGKQYEIVGPCWNCEGKKVIWVKDPPVPTSTEGEKP